MGIFFCLFLACTPILRLLTLLLINCVFADATRRGQTRDRLGRRTIIIIITIVINKSSSPLSSSNSSSSSSLSMTSPLMSPSPLSSPLTALSSYQLSSSNSSSILLPSDGKIIMVFWKIYPVSHFPTEFDLHICYIVIYNFNLVVRIFDFHFCLPDPKSGNKNWSEAALDSMDD